MLLTLYFDFVDNMINIVDDCSCREQIRWVRHKRHLTM